MVYEHSNQGTLTLIEPEGLKYFKQVIEEHNPHWSTEENRDYNYMDFYYTNNGERYDNM
jgi:hypothetical protein